MATVGGTYSPRLGIDGFVHDASHQVHVRKGVFIEFLVVLVLEVGFYVAHQAPDYGVVCEGIVVYDGDLWDVGGLGWENLEWHD